MILFVKYIANGKRKQLVISMVLLFLAEISYEAFVMYVPLYCLFAILQKGINKDNLKTILMPIANALIFLVLYMLCSKLFPSNYTGNQIQIINIKNSLKIIAELLKSTLPGRYLFSAKYRYLFEIYHKNDWHNIIRECVLAIFVIIILRKLITMKLLNGRKSAVKSLLLVLLFGTAGAILPTIPVSISSMYQNSIGENGFLALPVTFFGYFWSVFLVCYIIWQITAIFKSSVVRDVVIILCMMIIIPIQMMNDTFADEEYSNFVRLETIESFIKSATIKKFDGNTFYCPDLYETKNALAIHDGYWTDYANATGLDMNFKNEIDNNPNYIYVYIINDDIFEILTDSNLIIMSKNRIGSPVVAKINNDDYAVIECNEYDNDETDWYVYTFERSIVRR